jgi:phage terminase small subunit
VSLTVKQEAFCQLVAKGASVTAAYRQAYNIKGKSNGIYSLASRLAAHAKVVSRIGELKGPATAIVNQTVTVDLMRTLFENARIGFSDIRHLLTPGGNLKPPGEWDDDTAAAVSSIKVRALFGEGKDGVGQIGTLTEVKLWDKGAALDRLMKHLGMYERDNAQRAGLFDSLPAEVARSVIEQINALAEK